MQWPSLTTRVRLWAVIIFIPLFYHNRQPRPPPHASVTRYELYYLPAPTRVSYQADVSANGIIGSLFLYWSLLVFETVTLGHVQHMTHSIRVYISKRRSLRNKQPLSSSNSYLILTLSLPTHYTKRCRPQKSNWNSTPKTCLSVDWDLADCVCLCSLWVDVRLAFGLSFHRWDPYCMWSIIRVDVGSHRCGRSRQGSFARSSDISGVEFELTRWPWCTYRISSRLRLTRASTCSILLRHTRLANPSWRCSYPSFPWPPLFQVVSLRLITSYRGRVIRELGFRRTDLVITTKIFWGLRKGPNDTGLSRKQCVFSCCFSRTKEANGGDGKYCWRYQGVFGALGVGLRWCSLCTSSWSYWWVRMWALWSTSSDWCCHIVPMEEIVRAFNYVIERGWVRLTALIAH